MPRNDRSDSPFGPLPPHKLPNQAQRDRKADAEFSRLVGAIGAIPVVVLVVLQSIFLAVALNFGWSPLLWIPGVVAAGLAVLALAIVSIGPDRGYKFGVIALGMLIYLSLFIQFILCAVAAIAAVVGSAA